MGPSNICLRGVRRECAQMPSCSERHIVRAVRLKHNVDKPKILVDDLIHANAGQLQGVSGVWRLASSKNIKK